MSLINPKGRFKIAVKLEGADNYARWRSSLQQELFANIKNNNMDALTPIDTLEAKYFKDQFKDEWKAASRNSGNEVMDPFTDPNFAGQCYDHALKTGLGFHVWLYEVFAGITRSLCEEIADKIAGVTQGDLIGLLKCIKLAIGHFEITNPEDLDIEYSKCNMQEEGANDVMLYTAALAKYMRRLQTAGHKVSDAKAQRVLLHGLNQDIFENFILNADRSPHRNYTELVQALLNLSSKPHTLKKLRALKPGNAHSTLVTRSTVQPQQPDARMDKIEAILMTLAETKAQNDKSRGSGSKLWRGGRSTCHRFQNTGSCHLGDTCKFEHASDYNTREQRGGQRKRQPQQPTGKYCELHKSDSHDTCECSVVKNNPQLQALYKVGQNQQVQATTHGHSDFIFTTRVTFPQYILATQGAPKIDMWCVDGAATTMATYDRTKCVNIRACHVVIHGPNGNDDTFICKEMGDAHITAYDKVTGKTTSLIASDVLISDAFPFHIFSEIVAFKRHCTATKKLGSWQFNAPGGGPLFHASQSLLGTNKSVGNSDVELYFIDEAPVGQDTQAPAVAASVHTMVKQAPAVPPPKVNTAKNLQALLELHCAHDHRNFEDIARRHGLSLPSPPPTCWACLTAKPKRMSHDKLSTRQVTRPFEGFAADAKGPLNTPTPEGYRYFFMIICLYSHFLWAILAKSQAEWKDIWQTFVKRAEAKSGKERCVAFIITDGHKVHMATSFKDFNDDRGIETITCAPHSQWQDPAERQIQTVMNGARASTIHGGGKPWMWGHAVRHSTDSTNRMEPPHVIAGHEGKSRLRIIDPSMTEAKEMRTLKPFLCLAFKTVPLVERGSNLKPRAHACVHLYYDRTRKAYALLTIPNLSLTHSVEVRFITMTFPLRVTNYLSNQLDTFLRPTVEDDLYRNIYGPGNILRRQRPGLQSNDLTMVVEQMPVQVRAPASAGPSLGPYWSSTRGYTPSAAGLQSAASVHTTTMTQPAPDTTTYTPDQLAARTPKTVYHALNGPDQEFWLPSVLKDFAILRDNKCIINITDRKPAGPSPPPVEQRFKIKYRGDKPTSLAAIPPADWKTRTVTRGDRFKVGLHYDATAAPVVATPTLKMVLAWAVAKGHLLYQWDQSHAFYGNKMDRTGIIVRLPPGYDPYSNALRPLHLPPLYGELAGALPGIPQGSLLHYKELAPILVELGFYQADADNCLFIHSDFDAVTTLHVDDGVLAVPSHHIAEQILGPNGLAGRKPITWGPLHCTLGIDFKIVYSAERRMVFMSQRAYAVTILERAGMLDCNPARTPASPGRSYTKADCPTTDAQKAELQAKGMTKELYHTVTASCNFLVTITREDMKFIQGKTAKFCLNPGLEHFKALKHALRFIKGTLDYGVEFVWRATDTPPADGPLHLEAWSDSSFADDIDTGRTTLGDVIKVNGATISASSKLSTRVDSCVNHSELHAFGAASAPDPNSQVLTDGASTALVRTGRTVTWARGIKAALERRDVSKMPPTPIYVDNAGVISMLEGVTLKSANKHIYRALAENRERVHLDKSVVAVKVDTKDNIANAMTKQEHGIRESAAQLRQIAGPMST
jgi:hypothetical protein